MKVLTLDLGTKLGWAFADTGTDTWIWGEEDFSLQRYEGGGMRFLRFDRWLAEMLQSVDMVVMEEIGFARYQQAAEILNGMKGILMAKCEAVGVPYAGVPVGTLKKFATGKGNAGKNLMAKALQERWDGVRPLNHPSVDIATLTNNEVDAIWLTAYAVQNLVPEHEGAQ